MKDVSVSKDTNTERKSQDKNQTKVENQKSSTYSLAKNGLGVATAALLVGGTMADLSRAQSSSSALDLRGSNNLTDRISPPLPSPEYLRKIGVDPQRFYQEVSQRTPGGETPSGFRSRKMTLSGEISRSATDVPSHQLEQGKSKGIESLKLSEEQMNSLKSFADSLKNNPEALEGFKDVMKDNEAMEGFINLMQNEVSRGRVLKELTDKNSVKEAVSVLENEQTRDACVSRYRIYRNKAKMEFYSCCKDEAGTVRCGINTEYDAQNIALIVVASSIAFSVIAGSTCNRLTKRGQNRELASMIAEKMQPLMQPLMQSTERDRRLASMIAEEMQPLMQSTERDRRLASMIAEKMQPLMQSTERDRRLASMIAEEMVTSQVSGPLGLPVSPR